MIIPLYFFYYVVYLNIKAKNAALILILSMAEMFDFGTLKMIFYGQTISCTQHNNNEPSRPKRAYNPEFSDP